MKAQVAEIKKQLGIVSPNIPRETPMPILENFLFRTQGNKVVIRTTDLASNSSTLFEQEIEESENNEVVVPKLFAELISLLPTKETLEITRETNKKLKVVRPDRKGQYFISILNGEEFPAELEKIEGIEVDILREVLLDVLEGAVWATKRNDFNPRFSSLFLEIEKGERIKATATDGQMIAHIERILAEPDYSDDEDVQETSPEKLTGSYLISADHVYLIIGMLKSSIEERVKLNLRPTYLRVDIANQVFECRLVGTGYVNYSSVFPSKEGAHCARVSREDLFDAVKIANAYSLTKDKRTLPIELDFTLNQLIVRSSDEDGNESEQKILCSYDGEDVKFNIAGSLLYRALSNSKRPEISLRVKDERTPIALKHCFASDNARGLILIQTIQKKK